MTSLHELQHKFVRAILENKPEMICDEIIPDGMTPEERYNIYHNNSFITLSQALAQNFPVLNQLVGQAFFNQMAQEYVKIYPPLTPILMCYGEDMPRFLKHYPPVCELPYLPDVAQLEHLWNECFNGPDSNGFDLALLNEVDPDKFNGLIFTFLPNIQYMSSEYPVSDIWLAHQGSSPLAKEINIDQGGCYLVVFRKMQQVEIISFDLAIYDFIRGLHSGQTLGQSAGEIMEKHPKFNLKGALQAIMQSGIIENFTLNET